MARAFELLGVSLFHCQICCRLALCLSCVYAVPPMFSHQRGLIQHDKPRNPEVEASASTCSSVVSGPSHLVTTWTDPIINAVFLFCVNSR